jgi:hypothetical protein
MGYHMGLDCLLHGLWYDDSLINKFRFEEISQGCLVSLSFPDSLQKCFLMDIRGWLAGRPKNHFSFPVLNCICN